MKNILLFLQDDDGQESRLQSALDLTRALEGHLTCLDVVVPPGFPPEYNPGPAHVPPILEVQEREAENVGRVRARLENEDVMWEIRQVTGEPVRRLTEAAALADVIVVSSRSAGTHGRMIRRTVTQLAVRSGRLVLAVPPACTRLNVAGKALVAWDGSHEADQALRAALPLLQLADAVTLMQVNASGDPVAAHDAASYLARHGAQPLVAQETTTAPVAEIVLRHARQWGASYIVMGAFGHARVAETIFGGVTADMLRTSELPVFLHH